MERKSLLISSVLVCLYASGCGGESISREGDHGTSGTSAGTGSGGVGAASGSGGATECTDSVVARAANNYSLSTRLAFSPIGVQPNQELHFRWNGVTKDLLGHSLDPASSIDAVHVAMWNLTPEELAAKLEKDDLRADDLSFILTVFTEKKLTEAGLFEFTSAGTPLDPETILPFFDAEAYPPSEQTYTLMIASSETLGRGTRMIQAFRLNPASTNTLVEMTDASTRVEYSVDLRSHERTLIPLGTGDISIDWEDMTTTARGETFVPTAITRVVVARYDESVAELEERFLDLELISEDMWQADVSSGTTLAFSSLRNDAGQPFAGIDGTGTWLVALVCGECLNPAPWYLSVLSPCPSR